MPGIPHVVGVTTADGESSHADVIVDAGGRRAPLPAWLQAIGAKPPIEELDDSGFVYYFRHFRSLVHHAPRPCDRLATGYSMAHQ